MISHLQRRFQTVQFASSIIVKSLPSGSHSQQVSATMSTIRLRSRGLSPSSQGRSSSASSSAVPGGGSSSQRRSARLESCPTSSQVQGRREREQRRGCPPAPHNSLDQSVILLDDILALQVSLHSPPYTSPHHSRISYIPLFILDIEFPKHCSFLNHFQ